MVTVFRPLLEEFLSVIEIIPKLHFIENHQRYITKASECGRVAMGLLLDAIEESEDPGKWTTFLEALTAAGRTQHQAYYNGYLNPCSPNYETKPPIPPPPPRRRSLSETEKLQQQKAELEARLVECKTNESLRKEIQKLQKEIYAIERANDEDCDISTEVQDGDVDTRHPPKTVQPVSTENSSNVVPVNMDSVKVLVKEEIEAQVKPLIVELQKLISLIGTIFGTAAQTNAPPTAHLQRLNTFGYVTSSRDQDTSGYDSNGYAESVYAPYSSNFPNDHEEMYV